MARPLPRLLFGDTTTNRDMFHFGRVEIEDPFPCLESGGRKVAVVNALEFGRVRRTSDFDRVLRLEPFAAEARARWPRTKPGPAEVIRLVAERLKEKAFAVSPDFPAGLYLRLRRLGLELEVARGPLFPERELKTSAEAAAIREGNRCAALGIAAARDVLRRSTIRGGRLFHRGSALTSERLHAEIEIACAKAGSTAGNPIAAGGDQAGDGHERGSGPLRANELIVVDVFPRVKRTGYCGDMTRTFLRGRASDAQRALVAAVRDAQRAALGAVRAGTPGVDVYRAAVALFNSRGYWRKDTRTGSVGYSLGIGHGLGLAVHDGPPSLSGRGTEPLKAGAVVTVEPALYYPGVGRCRFEDVVQVTEGSPRLLSAFPYDWEIRQA